jgi:hypothetical protein
MLATSLQAQNDPDYEKNTNFGIKLGISASTMFGGELANPEPLMGYVAGIYYHNKLDKKLIHYQTGLDLRLRGSNFNNVNETQENRTYSRIGIISVDIPLNLLIKVGEFTKVKANHIMFGIQPGYIFRSVVYIGADQMPLNSGNFSSTWDNLPLKNIELTGLWAMTRTIPLPGTSPRSPTSFAATSPPAPPTPWAPKAHCPNA